MCRLEGLRDTAKQLHNSFAYIIRLVMCIYIYIYITRIHQSAQEFGAVVSTLLLCPKQEVLCERCLCASGEKTNCGGKVGLRSIVAGSVLVIVVGRAWGGGK